MRRSSAAAGRKMGGEPSQAVSSRKASVGSGGGADRQPMRMLSPMTVSGRQHGAVADEGALADVIAADGHDAIPRPGRAQRDAVGDEALVADGEQVGRDEGGGGDFGAVAELCAQQSVPGRQIDGGVERAEDVEAEVQGLVDEPLAEIVEGCAAGNCPA